MMTVQTVRKGEVNIQRLKMFLENCILKIN